MKKDSLDDKNTTSPARKRPPLRLIAVGVIAILAVILVLQNTDSVETRILFASVTMPRAVLLSITFLLGVVVGLLAAFLRKRKKG